MSELPVDMGGNFVDLAYGQLRPHGASYELIQAVRNADVALIRLELARIKDAENRLRLTAIIQHIGPILGRRR